MTKRQPPGPTLNTAQPGLSRARRLAPDGPAHKVTDFYYFSNGFHAVRSVVQPIDQVVSLQRSNPDAVPYRLDAWTGDVERIATFEEDGPDQIRVRVALRPGETTIIAFGRRDWHNDQAGHGLHATSSDAYEVRFTDRDLSIRTCRPGSTPQLGPIGTTVTTTVDAVLAAQDLPSLAPERRRLAARLYGDRNHWSSVTNSMRSCRGVKSRSRPMSPVQAGTPRQWSSGTARPDTTAHTSTSASSSTLLGSSSTGSRCRRST